MNKLTNKVLLKTYLLFIFTLLFVVNNQALQAQETNPQNGEKYIIGGIAVVGETSFSEQTIITYSGLRAGEEVQQWNVDFIEKEDKTGLEVLTENGMIYNEISSQNRQKFIDIAKGLYSDFSTLVGDADLFNKTIEFCGKNK